MKCNLCQNLLFEYFDETLSPSVQTSIAEHLKHCHVCRKVFEEEQRFSGSMSALLEQQTRSLQLRPGFQEKILSLARQHSRRFPIPFPAVTIGPRMRWALAIAACLLIASITAFLIWQPSFQLTKEQNRDEPSPWPLKAQRADRPIPSAVALEAAMAKIKADQTAFFSSMESRRQRYFDEMAQRADRPIPSAVALEAAMTKIKADQTAFFSSMESRRQRYFDEMKSRPKLADKS